MVCSRKARMSDGEGRSARGMAIDGWLANAMLNDILAVCVAGMVVVVIATILGGVELLRKAVGPRVRDLRGKV